MCCDLDFLWQRWQLSRTDMTGIKNRGMLFKCLLSSCLLFCSSDLSFIMLFFFFVDFSTHCFQAVLISRTLNVNIAWKLPFKKQYRAQSVFIRVLQILEISNDLCSLQCSTQNKRTPSKKRIQELLYICVQHSCQQIKTVH